MLVERKYHQVETKGQLDFGIAPEADLPNVLSFRQFWCLARLIRMEDFVALNLNSAVPVKHAYLMYISYTPLSSLQ